MSIVSQPDYNLPRRPVNDLGCTMEGEEEREEGEPPLILIHGKRL